jgi:hypothetical protein
MKMIYCKYHKNLRWGHFWPLDPSLISEQLYVFWAEGEVEERTSESLPTTDTPNTGNQNASKEQVTSSSSRLQ